MAALRKKIEGLEHNRLVFCRNDPTLVAGSHAERKPDVVGVWESALDGVRSSVNNLSDKGPSEAPFFWHELLVFVEFKLVHTKIVYPQTAQTNPPPRRERFILIRTAHPDTCTSHSSQPLPTPLLAASPWSANVSLCSFIGRACHGSITGQVT
jgi:hypothetical protein